MNKKGMLGNIIGGFIVIFIGLSLVPVITQEIDNMYNCGNNSYNTTVIVNYDEPLGSTDSFGGGGAGQFGGYDGKVHKSWASQYAIVKTNKSFLGNCNSNMTSPITPVTKEMLDLMPIIFTLVILSIVGCYTAFRVLSYDDDI